MFSGNQDRRFPGGRAWCILSHLCGPVSCLGDACSLSFGQEYSSIHHCCGWVGEPVCAEGCYSAWFTTETKGTRSGCLSEATRVLTSVLGKADIALSCMFEKPLESASSQVNWKRRSHLGILNRRPCPQSPASLRKPTAPLTAPLWQLHPLIRPSRAFPEAALTSDVPSVSPILCDPMAATCRQECLPSEVIMTLLEPYALLLVLGLLGDRPPQGPRLPSTVGESFLFSGEV